MYDEDTSFIDENTRSRSRLHRLVESLTGEELRRETRDGWTVAALLVHLAFWDIRAWELLHRWQTCEIVPSPVDIDVINDSLKPICLEVSPSASLHLVLHSADRLDSFIESLPLDWVNRAAQQGRLRRRRCEHREEHCDEIEAVLGRSYG
jgi:hypothetical protein